VVPGSGGLSFEDVRAALKEIARHKNLVGLNVAQFNPDKDGNGDCAKKIVELLVESLSARLETVAASNAESAAPGEESSAGTTA
jgi:arginase family enzyme